MATSPPILRVSPNARHLQSADGRPFFFLADTAWELFHQLDREETTHYLEDRAAKGFTVIMAVVLAERDGLRKPNAYGEIPLLDLDPARPNPRYFEHVDFVVEKAAELGLVIGMLPTWGDKVTDALGGSGPVIFNPANARSFGAFLGQRYRHRPLIWILGGDRNIDSDPILETWRAMAHGLRSGDEGRHLITFHPRGMQTSSCWLHNEDWLDFNLYQSAHLRKYQRVYDFALNDYLLQPPKPTVEGEPAYEDIPVHFWVYIDWQTDPEVRRNVLDDDNLIRDPGYFEEGFFDAVDMRVHAYWNLLSGACGFAYGNNAVWQMLRKGEEPAIPTLCDWRDALDRPGARQVSLIKALFLSRDFSRLRPDQAVVYGPNPHDENHVRAASAEDGSFALAYLPQGKSIIAVLGKIAGPRVRAWWFDPRCGEALPAGAFENRGHATFEPPSSGHGHDWVLVLEDASAFDKPPGA
ncbi:MAG: DUF4038 domain-containing protein [Puniceicoccaceae bacterium]|nr:MAG: DUF4038 domain-containing protein [Puniceicoccaceae bacterium]